MDVEIRPIQNSDAESFRLALDSVAKEKEYLLLEEAPPIDSVRFFIANNIEKGYPQFVAVKNDAVIGWADLIPPDLPGLKHSARLGMGVIKYYRGMGLGSALLKSVIDAAVGSGFVRLELEVYTANQKAISLYKRFGFEEEGKKTRYRYIDGRYYDALIMARIIA